MLGAKLDAPSYFEKLQSEIGNLDQAAIKRWSDLVFERWESGRFVFVFGNGGAGTTASHVHEDFAKGSIRKEDLLDESKKRLKIISLNDSLGWITAVGNDMGFEHIFQQQLMNYASQGDLAIAMSGSGSSPNVIQAVEWCKRHGVHTYGMTGYNGGKLKEIQDEGLHVPVDDMGMVQSIHLCVFHWVLDDVFARINSEGRYA